MLMSGADYRESLRRFSPRVYLNGRQVPSIADEPLLAPGVNAVALTYDYALREDLGPLMRAGHVNRMLAVPRSSDDLLNKLEAVRVVCQQTGCAQRYLVGDAFSALASTTREIGSDYADRFAAYMQTVYDEDLSVGIAMTDGKGDRSLRPHAQPRSTNGRLRLLGAEELGLVRGVPGAERGRGQARPA